VDFEHFNGGFVLQSGLLDARFFYSTELADAKIAACFPGRLCVADRPADRWRLDPSSSPMFLLLRRF
jgi:hypothetical protein